MIDLIGSIFTKKMLGDTIGSALGAAFGNDGGSAPSRTPPPSFRSAYMTDSGYESQAGKAETIDTSDPNVLLQLWQRRLFSGADSYSKITLPSVRNT
tara:strand:+ start:82 stop:372 length:291 start_codon:yes stop_codon:yes gene_type:complete